MKKAIALGCIVGVLILALYFTSPKTEEARQTTVGEETGKPARTDSPSILQLLPEGILESMSQAHARLISRVMGNLLEIKAYTTEGTRTTEIKGWGIALSNERYIITPTLGYAKAQHITVTWNNTTLQAAFVAQDVESGVTFLKVNDKTIPTVDLAANANMGDFVLLCRYDYLLKTMGASDAIISRSATAPIRAGFNDVSLLAMEIPRPRDSSTGLLFNLRGQLVGTETMVYGGLASSDISYVISNTHIQWLLKSIEQHGRIIRGSLGADFQDIDSELAIALGVKQKTGILVSGVTTGSPAAKAGLKEGDVILSAMGEDAKSAKKLRQTINLMTIGTEVDLKVARENAITHYRVQVEEATPPSLEAVDLRRIPK